MEIREELDKHDFNGDDVPIIRGSALNALHGKDGQYGKDAIIELMSAVDSYIPVPKRAVDGDYIMPVEGTLLFFLSISSLSLLSLFSLSSLSLSLSSLSFLSSLCFFVSLSLSLCLSVCVRR